MNHVILVHLGTGSPLTPGGPNEPVWFIPSAQTRSWFPYASHPNPASRKLACQVFYCADLNCLEVSARLEFNGLSAQEELLSTQLITFVSRTCPARPI